MPRRSLIWLASVVVCTSLLGCGETVPPADAVSPDTATDLGDASSDPPGFGEATTDPPAASTTPADTATTQPEAAAPKADEPAAENTAEPEAATPKAEIPAEEKPAEAPSDAPTENSDTAVSNEPARPEPPALPEPINP